MPQAFRVVSQGVDDAPQGPTRGPGAVRCTAGGRDVAQPPATLRPTLTRTDGIQSVRPLRELIRAGKNLGHPLALRRTEARWLIASRNVSTSRARPSRSFTFHPAS